MFWVKNAGNKSWQFSPKTCLSLNHCSGHNFCATECSKSLDWTLVDTWFNGDFYFFSENKNFTDFLTYKIFHPSLVLTTTYLRQSF